MANAGSDITGGTVGGLSAGAGIGTAIAPGVGTAIGAGIGAVVGALGGVAKWLFGRSEAKKRKKEAERLAAEQKKRHEEFIQTAEKRAGELYEKYKADPEAIKQEYGESVKRALEQQAGGMTAALSSQRRVNPALASHLLANQAADVQAKASGETALAQTQLGTQFDIYNKQLMQQIRNQELAYEGKEEERQAGYAEDALKTQQAMRQQMIDDLFSSVSKGIEGGAVLSQIGRNKPTQQGNTYLSEPQTPWSKYSLSNPAQNPWDKYSLLNNPSINYGNFSL